MSIITEHYNLWFKFSEKHSGWRASTLG